jgi:hypothetical protein
MNRYKMTIKKGRSDKRFKHTEARETTRLKTDDDAAANAIRELIKSMSMSAEQKITLDDGINNLAKEIEGMMDGIDMASRTTDQKKLLAAYKKFLEHAMETVNRKLREID